MEAASAAQEAAKDLEMRRVRRAVGKTDLGDHEIEDALVEPRDSSAEVAVLPIAVGARLYDGAIDPRVTLRRRREALCHRGGCARRLS